MRTNHISTRGTAAIVLTALISGSALIPAMAETDMESTLCDPDCSITATEKRVVEGKTLTVDVTGAPGASVELQLFDEAGTKRLSDPVPVTLDDKGAANGVEISVKVVEGAFGGNALVHVSDWDGTTEGPLTQATVEVLRATPMLWNFSEPDADGKVGFQAKQGGEFLVQFAHAIPGEVHLLEVLVDGKWVLLNYEPQDQAGPVTFQVQDAIPAGLHPMRSVNTARSTTGPEDIFVLQVDAVKDKPETKPSKPGKSNMPSKPGKDKAKDKPSLPKSGV